MRAEPVLGFKRKEIGSQYLPSYRKYFEVEDKMRKAKSGCPAQLQSQIDFFAYDQKK